MAGRFTVVHAAQPEAPPTFDAASIKPNHSIGGRGGTSGVGRGLLFAPGRVAGTMVTATQIIQAAYHLSDYQFPPGGSGWLDSDRFDLDARAAAPASESQLRQMLVTLLAERFKLVVHREPKEMMAYALTVGRNGLKLREQKEGDPVPKPPPPPPPPALTMFVFMRMQGFVDMLSSGPISQRYIGRPVLDRTGLKGLYLFQLTWGPDDEFMSAVQKQLGLRFESEKASVDILVIDHIEKPDAN